MNCAPFLQLSRFRWLVPYSNRGKMFQLRRDATTTATGAVLPVPEATRFGLFGIFCTVTTGLLIGATISKKMANFLEENELFVPADDDDDDD